MGQRAQSHPMPYFPLITCHRSLTIRPALELQVRTGGKLERGGRKCHRGCAWGRTGLQGDLRTAGLGP